MIVDTTRFGTVEIDPKNVITLNEGMIGFPGYRRFCLIEHEPGNPFRWLQCLDEPSLAFVVADPLSFFPNYEVEIPTEDARALKIRRTDDALVLTTISIRRPPEGITANLLGPVVVGLKSRRARQIIQDAEVYSARMPLPIREMTTSRNTEAVSQAA